MNRQQGILLRGGTILQHNDHDEVEALLDTDVLIEGSHIRKIGKNIKPSPDVGVLDCKGKIISPGFIDTHHHVWQTQLKGRHSDDTLLDYHPKGNLMFWNYTAEDIFWGELGGLLEAMDAGTTCIVDHAHMSGSPEQVYAGALATLASGIRSVFCYSLVPHIHEWKDDLKMETKPIPAWFFDTFDRMTKVFPTSDGLIQLGLGFDGYHLPSEEVVRVFEAARKHSVKIITSHWRRNTVAGSSFSVPNILEDLSLLGPDIILSHSTGSTNEELRLLREAGAYTASTPATESQMAHGDIVGFRDDVLAAMGADCHSNNPASMLHAMQVGLAVVRAQRNSHILAQDRFPRYCEPTTRHAFNLATIRGARAIGAIESLGSLREGKLADVVVFNTSSPAMTCAADEDPLNAVVRHASPQDVDTVIVGGQIKKQNGQLLDVSTPFTSKSTQLLEQWLGKERVERLAHNGTLSWSQVAKELQRSRKDIQSRIDTCNVDAARKKVLQMWGSKDEDAVLV